MAKRSFDSPAYLVCCSCVVGIALLFPAAAYAQPQRYELGLRLRAFERAWDQIEQPEAKRRAVGPMNQAVRAFFSFDFPAVGEALDRARHALGGTAPSPEVRWADSLYVDVPIRLVDSEETELKVTLAPFYRVDGALPTGAKLRLRIAQADPVEVPIEGLPMTVALPLTERVVGDVEIRYEILIRDMVVAARAVAVSRVETLHQRLDSLRWHAEQVDKPTTIEQATLRHLVGILSGMANRQIPETDLPAARLLAEAEQVAEAIRSGQAYYNSTRSGQFWLRVPTDQSEENVRILIPECLAERGSVPILFALHGAGGSENLFFDSYGDGVTAKICQERGWIMVATNAGGFLRFGSPPRVVQLLDVLSTRYPIDKRRVYLVGHSMGAGHVLALAQQASERLAGIALLGGGGAARRAEALKDLPCFIGCGKQDFALAGARRLSNSLQQAGLSKLMVKEYDEIEHMMIVREAIRDVFAFWDHP